MLSEYGSAKAHASRSTRCFRYDGGHPEEDSVAFRRSAVRRPPSLNRRPPSFRRYTLTLKPGFRNYVAEISQASIVCPPPRAARRDGPRRPAPRRGAGPGRSFSDASATCTARWAGLLSPTYRARWSRPATGRHHGTPAVQVDRQSARLLPLRLGGKVDGCGASPAAKDMLRTLLYSENAVSVMSTSHLRWSMCRLDSIWILLIANRSMSHIRDRSGDLQPSRGKRHGPRPKSTLANLSGHH